MELPQTLLGLLDPAPRHGYDLRREYDAAFGSQRPVKPAQVYATLGRLLRDGEITVVGINRVVGPDRTSYVRTAAGVTHLERWLAEPEPVTPYLQSVDYTKVVLALRSGRPAEQILHGQRAVHLVVMRDLTDRKRRRLHWVSSARSVMDGGSAVRDRLGRRRVTTAAGAAGGGQEPMARGRTPGVGVGASTSSAPCAALYHRRLATASIRPRLKA